jgi:hypothetical protein
MRRTGSGGSLKSGHSLVGRRLRVLVPAVMVLVGASSALGQYPPANPSGYRVVPAPESTTAFLGSARSFNWVDNDRLLFLANDRELSTTKKDKERTVVVKAVPTIHLWDFRAQTIRRYQPEPLANWLCAVDGRVWYGLERNGETVVFEGLFGQERPRAPTPTRIGKDGQPFGPLLNRFTCREYWFAELPRLHRGRSFPLRHEDGVFERIGSDIKGAPEWEGPLPPFKRWIHKENGSTEIAFPQERISQPLAYSSIAGGYLFSRVQGRIERGVTNRIYFLETPSYLVRYLDILGNQNWAILGNYTVTSRGVLGVSNVPSPPNVKWDPGPAGMYLFYGAPIADFLGRKFAAQNANDALPFISYERITRGIVEVMSAASPNGCRVVVVTDPWDQENRRFRLEIVDFCESAK